MTRLRTGLLAVPYSASMNRAPTLALPLAAWLLLAPGGAQAAGFCAGLDSYKVNPIVGGAPIDLCRHDVQSFAHVFANAHHGLAASHRWARGVLGVVAMLDSAQMLGQGLTTGLALVICRWRCTLLAGALQGLQLSLQAGLVLGCRFFEHLALLGVHPLGLGTELPGLQARQQLPLFQFG